MLAVYANLGKQGTWGSVPPASHHEQHPPDATVSEIHWGSLCPVTNTSSVPRELVYYELV